MLTITEKLILSWLGDEKHTMQDYLANIKKAIAGAILFDLFYFGRISIIDDSAIIKNYKKTGVKLLDETLTQILNKIDNMSPANLLAAVESNVGGLEAAMGKTIQQRGIFPEGSGGSFLPENNGKGIKSIPDNLNYSKVINDCLANECLPEKNLFILINLLEYTGLLKHLIGGEKYASFSAQIEEICGGGFVDQDMALAEALFLKSVTNALKSEIAENS